MTALPATPLVHHEHPARWAHGPTPLPLPRQRPDDDPPTGRGVLYGSFACPWSYLASQRTDRIPDPALRPVWRMIDPDAAPGTRLAAPGRRLDPPAAQKAAAGLAAVRALLLPGEHLPDRPPALLPHTGPAVVGYAEAVGAGVGDQVRPILFDAYWRQGLDIGLPEVLRRLLHTPLRAGTSTVQPISEHGYAVTLTGGPVTTAAHHRLRRWHEDRPTFGGPALALITDQGTTQADAALSALAGRRTATST